MNDGLIDIILEVIPTAEQRTEGIKTAEQRTAEQEHNDEGQ
jgi:hypothetical protein